MSRWLNTCVAVSILGLLVLDWGPAFAQDVHVEPDSPAGREYALPLDAARRAAAGPGSEGASGESAPVFGAGISKRDASGPEQTSGSDGRAAGPGSGASQGSSGGQQGPGVGGADATRAARAVADTGGLSPGLLAVLIALGVVTVGALIGLSVRSLRRSHPSG